MIGAAKTDASKAGQGKLVKELVLKRAEVEHELIDEKMDTSWWGTINKTVAGAQSMSGFGGKSGRKVLIEERALKNAREEAGVAAGRNPLYDAMRAALGPLSAIMPTGTRAEAALGDNAETLRVLKEQNEHLKEANKQRGAARKPLTPDMIPVIFEAVSAMRM